MKDAFRRLLYKYKSTSWIMIIRKRYHDWRTIAYPIIKQKWKNPNAVFFVLTPDHGNIGDHAIAVATKKMLDKIGISCIEIPVDKLIELDLYGFLSVFNGRTILVNGGGNLGTLWFRVEDIFRNIIKSNKKSNIICLPNTIYYENSNYGLSEFENSIRIYNSHKNLYLYAREKTSYDIMFSAYKNVYLVPDMVMSLDYSKEKFARKGCLLCLRNDLEKTMDNDTLDKLKATISNLFGAYEFTDMCASYRISAVERQNEVTKKANEFKKAELVITDRLHGMIFCAITGTPCIVLDSKSHKVKGCYEWIKKLEYIRFASSIDEIQDLYASIPKKEFIYDNFHLMEYYKQLQNDLIKYCKRKRNDEL